MANKKITDLPAGHVARADDLFECTQDTDTTAVSNQISVEELPVIHADVPPAVGDAMDDEFVDPDLLPGGGTPIWAWVNQGGATITDDKSSLLTVTNFVAGQSLRALVQNLPATPWAFVTKFNINGPWGVDHQLHGLVLRDSASGKLISYSLGFSGSLRFRVNQWSSPTGAAGELFTVGHIAYSCYMKIADNGTTRSYHVSWDGLQWTQIFSHGNTTYLTADQIGLMMYFEAASGNSLVSFEYFRRVL